MLLGEVTFYLAISGIFSAILYKLFGPKKDDREYEKKIASRLKNELLYDPESGAKFTIDQAEAGAWIKNDNYSRVRPPEELEDYYDGAEVVIEQIANYLKESNHQFVKFDSSEIKILESTKILEKYDDWSYVNAFQIDEAKKVIFPEVTIVRRGRGTIGFNGHQIMFWLKTTNISGHYFLRNKESIEKIFDLFRSDDDFEFGSFEVFTITHSLRSGAIKSILKPLERLKNIEIEIHDENLFIKTTDNPSMAEFEELLALVMAC